MKMGIDENDEEEVKYFIDEINEKIQNVNNLRNDIKYFHYYVNHNTNEIIEWYETEKNEIKSPNEVPVQIKENTLFTQYLREWKDIVLIFKNMNNLQEDELNDDLINIMKSYEFLNHEEEEKIKVQKSKFFKVIFHEEKIKFILKNDEKNNITSVMYIEETKNIEENEKIIKIEKNSVSKFEKGLIQIKKPLTNQKSFFIKLYQIYNINESDNFIKDLKKLSIDLRSVNYYHLINIVAKKPKIIC
jgi:hypothetical protein